MEDSVRVKFDEQHVYACRCPSCRKCLNISGISLNSGYAADAYFNCPYCGAQSKVRKWVKEAPRCQMSKS